MAAEEQGAHFFLAVNTLVALYSRAQGGLSHSRRLLVSGDRARFLHTDNLGLSCVCPVS